MGKTHTIILSSHILPEVSAVCERVVIINKGKIVAVDTPEQLSKNLGDYSKFTMTIAGPDKKVKEMLQQIYGVKEIEVQNRIRENEFSYIIEADKDIDVRKPIFHKLAEFGYPILELKSLSMSLEDIFLQLTTEEKEVN